MGASAIGVRWAHAAGALSFGGLAFQALARRGEPITRPLICLRAFSVLPYGHFALCSLAGSPSFSCTRPSQVPTFRIGDRNHELTMIRLD